MTEKFKDPKMRFIARDLSWLKFNRRVLHEAKDLENPFFERLKFLAIFVNNLDEFLMVRVAGMKNLIDSNVQQKDKFGFYPQDLLKEVEELATTLIDDLYHVYEKKAIPELKKNKIYFKSVSDLKRSQQKHLKQYFDQTLYPIVTPLAVDPGHPFPVLPSKTLALAVELKQPEENLFAVIPVPRNVPRLIQLPQERGSDEVHFVFVEDVLREFVGHFFQGFTVSETCLFRVIRDSELSLDEDSAPDLLTAMEGEIHKRRTAKAVYLEVESHCSKHFLDLICNPLEFEKEDVIRVKRHLDLTFLFQLISQVKRPDLCDKVFKPGKMEYENIFTRMREEDFLLHVPFQSFQPTVDLLKSAAKDKHVLAIKLTLYRADKDSSIISALKDAALSGKQVTVFVEIKARFDEENNIKWARQLEQAGCHVVYGIPGLKVHSKMALVVREENGQIIRYVHLSTGNYNEKTAKIYTDMGYFTCNEDFARDVSDLFNVITGYSVQTQARRVVSAPKDMRDYIFSLIDREIKFQKENKNGYIQAKFNSLEDVKIIDKLYEASQTGVQIDLIVRGICCLIPGVENLSENIRVRSVVGRFLEHTRIFIFNNNQSPRVFLASADWMARNFDRRVESFFEIYQSKFKKEIRELFKIYWADQAKSWELGSDRRYVKEQNKKQKKNIHNKLIERYQ